MFEWLKSRNLVSCRKCFGYGSAALVCVLLLFFQNCSETFTTQASSQSTNTGSTTPTPAPQPAPPAPPPMPPQLPPPPSPPVTPSNQTPSLNRTDFVTGRSSPWDLAFTSDNYMFFTEKCNGLFVRNPTGTITKLFGTSGAALVASDFFCEGQSGMHGVAIDPNFATNRYVYIYMSSNLSTNPRSNRVVRLVVSANYAGVSDRVDIISDIAFKNVGNSWGASGSHSGGRIRFGPDGYLYVTTGDNHNGTLPQSLQRMGGKVLRVDRNGAAAPGNNTPAGGDPRIYTYGHRNVQGIAFRPNSNQIYTSEHGPGHSDEVTRLIAGGNSGWDPVPESGVSCADSYCGYISNKIDGTLTPMTDTVKFPNAMRPVWNNGGMSQGTGPSTFISGPQWKAWDGRLLVGIMGAERLAVIQLDANGVLTNAVDATLTRARYRSLVQGPDGNLYIATDGGAIWRVTPQ